MKCANNHELSQEIKIGKVKVDRCAECGGLWFNRDELRQAKDPQDDYAQWFDIDLWHNEETFNLQQSPRLCPVCQVPFYNIQYGDSGVRIDACKKCEGVWLDKDEFKNIIDFVEKRSAYDLLNNYVKSLIEEGKEIFTGPESLKSEISDFFIVLKLLQFKLVFGKPLLTNLLMNLPLTK